MEYLKSGNSTQRVGISALEEAFRYGVKPCNPLLAGTIPIEIFGQNIPSHSKMLSST